MSDTAALHRAPDTAPPATAVPELCPGCSEREAPGGLAFDGFHLRECPGCGLWFVSPTDLRRRPFDAGYLEGLLRHPERSRLFFGRQIERLGGAASLEGLRVLDVGFGAGAFLELAARAGAHVNGVEISADARHYVRARLPGARIDSCDGDLAGVDLPSASFDLVTFWNSLPYMDHPVRQLETAARLLRPGGRLVVEVSRRDPLCFRYARCLHALHPGLAAAFLHVPTARSLFPETFLRRSLERIGFDIVEVYGERARFQPRAVRRLGPIVLDVVDAAYVLVLLLLRRRMPVILIARRR